MNDSEQRNQMRAEFEAWAITGDNPLFEGDFKIVKSTDKYYWPITQIMWEAWQASRAALVVELPSLTGLDQQFTGTPISEIRAHNHYNKAISLCRTAIQSAGVSVK
jgi:hypothetical protein